MTTMRLLYEPLSDLGLIDDATPALTNFPVESIKSSESIPYRAVAGTTAFIRGSFASKYKFYRSNQFLIDALFISNHNCPVGTVVTFKLYETQQLSTLVHESTHIVKNTKFPIWSFVPAPVLAEIYIVEFTFPSSHSLEIYRMMVGHAFKPTYNHTNDFTLKLNVVNNTAFRLRNGGIRLEERTPYKSFDLVLTNQNSAAMGEFADICFHYGNYSDMAIILSPDSEDSGFSTASAFICRMLRWTEPSLSNAGYRWSFTVEELKL